MPSGICKCSRNQTTSTRTVISTSLVLDRLWIPGEHCRGICTVECATAHLRWFEEDLGSEVVFWFDVAHVHHHSRHLPIPPLQEKYNAIVGSTDDWPSCLIQDGSRQHVSEECPTVCSARHWSWLRCWIKTVHLRVLSLAVTRWKRVTEGRRPKDRSEREGVHSYLPGWHPKETAS